MFLLERVLLLFDEVFLLEAALLLLDEVLLLETALLMFDETAELWWEVGVEESWLLPIKEEMPTEEFFLLEATELT